MHVHPCTTTMFTYTDWDALYHTQTCRRSDEKWFISDKSWDVFVEGTYTVTPGLSKPLRSVEVRGPDGNIQIQHSLPNRSIETPPVC